MQRNIPGATGSPPSVTIHGPAYVYEIPLAATGNIAASSTLNLGTILASGFSQLSIGAELSQAGSIVAQRYLDAAGTIPAGAPITQPLTAATLSVLNAAALPPFQSLGLSIVNSSTLAATASNIIALLQA